MAGAERGVTTAASIRSRTPTMRSRHPRRRARWLLLAALVAGTGCGRSRAPSAHFASDTLWLVAGDPAHDAVHATDSEASLRARYGETNVVAGRVDVGEGQVERATILFPHDASRRLAILWADTLGRSRPTRVTVDGAPTRWVVAPGVSLGTSLAELERLNGRPFRLLGMGWDYAGTVVSWQGGRLDSLWRPPPGKQRLVWLRLHPVGAVDPALARRVAGDRELSSADSAMRRLDLRVYDLFVEPR